jgi:membrane-bound lytic murein transglycosylase B
MLALFAAVTAWALEPAHVAEVATAAGMPVAEVEARLATLSKDDTVLERMAKPWEAKPWHQYRTAFITEERITKGRAFRQAHADAFARAEATYKVPAEVVLAIIGVETMYGEKMGNDSVATALFTLGFYHPKRGSFFRTELGHFMRLAQDQSWDLTSRKGSYAGAMGMGQFMPSSYRQWAVDFDKDGATDLFNSPVDAIGSVANYLSLHGWAPGPILLDAKTTSDPAALLGKGLDLTQTVGQLREAGITLDPSVDGATKARLFKFDGASGPEYRVGLQNFWVITRYNRSTLYARAVTELSQSF